MFYHPKYLLLFLFFTLLFNLGDGAFNFESYRYENEKGTVTMSKIMFSVIIIFFVVSLGFLIKSLLFFRTLNNKNQINDDKTLSIPSQENPLSLSVKNLKFWLPSGQYIINGVSAIFYPGTITAIMGPSGCGKTSTLNMFAGQTKHGIFSVDFRSINGKKLLSESYSTLMQSQGYVKQTDTFFSDMTVWDTLFFSAMLRMGDMTIDEIVARVQQVLTQVGMEKHAHKIIGSSAGKGGLSGGQRRRLSVAIELLQMPSILLADEITSGLDSTSSLQIIQMLRKLAIEGKHTIILTIHQPRQEIFELLDQLLLLGVGGYPIYYGPSSKAVSYFQEKGIGSSLDVNKYSNPGDFIIDCMGLDPEKENSKEIPDPKAQSELWMNSQQFTELNNNIEQSLSNPSEITTFKEGFTTGTLTQLWVLFARKFRRISSSSQFKPTLFFYLQIIISVLVIAFAFSYRAPEESFTHAYQILMFLTIITSYAFIIQYLNLVPEYYDEREIVMNERESRVLRYVSYLFSSFLMDNLRAVIQSCLLGGVAYLIMDLNGPPYSYFFFLLLIIGVMCWQSMINFCCSLTDDIGLSYGIIFAFFGVGTLFGGLAVTYPSLYWIAKLFYFTSIPAMTIRGVLANDLMCCHLTTSCQYLQNTLVDLAIRGEAQKEALLLANTSLINCGPNTRRPGNLGQLFYAMLEFDKSASVKFVIPLVLILRITSGFCLTIREKNAIKIKEESPLESQLLTRDNNDIKIDQIDIKTNH